MKTPLHLFLLLILFSHRGGAQTYNIKFRQVTGKDGISLGKINGITQGTNGYMWFADQTQRCITRYDGYSMVSFRNDPLNSNSLGGTYPECIVSDASGHIWIGFTGTGLDRFDPETGQFRHFRHQPNDPASLSNDTVNALLVDHLGNIWVGSYGGLDLLDNQTGQFKHYRYDAADSTSLSNNRIRALYEDRQGTIWAGAGSAFESETRSDGGLNRFNRKTGTFTRYLSDPTNPATLINNKVRAIFEDSRGTFWVGTAGDGLHTMDRATGVFTRHTHHPAQPGQLSRPPVKEVDDHITFITEDKTGAIWIGTYKAGLACYNPATGDLLRFNPTMSKWSGFTDNSGWTTYTSRDGVLWLSTEQMTLYCIDPSYVTLPNMAAAGAVNSFFQEANGVLWMGTDSGLIRNDQNRGTVKRYIHDPSNPASISSDFVMGITKDKLGNLWVATNGGGLNKLDLKKQTFTHYKKNPKDNSTIASNKVFKPYIDQDGGLWVGTTGGLDQLNPTTGTFTHYQYHPQDVNSLSSNDVTDILQDRQKRLWVGAYYGGGVNVLDPGTHHFKHYLLGLDVNSLYQDSDGAIWAGTIGGLYRYDSRTDTFLLFADSGNDVRYNNVTSITEDSEKNLWVGTSEGIEKVNPARNKIMIYGKDHGVQHSLNFMAGYKGLNDELFFGAVTGYYHFFPQRLTTTAPNKPPEILIADLRLADKPVKHGQNSPLYQPLIKTKEIVLKYNQNTFSFDFGAIDYNDPEQNRHLYMLENYDDSWRPGDERTAYYFNVPPGHYTFRVKAANSNGIWAEKAISVIINPPWWRSWWAYTLYILVVASSIITVVRYRLSGLRHEVAHHKEKKQVAELQQQKTELEMQALRAQMNPHFIFNCLNSINHFILSNEPEAASDYLAKFSKLIRMVLNLSQKNLISLAEELEYLRLYIELEQLRFNNSFTYQVFCDASVDAQEVMIPPLLLQPFVENAIWHGLMHKAKNGVLNIAIVQEDDTLVCTITDNGIGRQKAAIFKSKSASYNKSMGMQLTANRLQMMHKEKNNDGFLDIIDLTDEKGEGNGTKVLIRIPVKRSESIPSLN